MTVVDVPPRTGMPGGASDRAARGRRWIGHGLVVCGFALLPWLVVLAYTDRRSLTWIGLDGLEAVGLVVTGLLVLRRDPRRTLAASATGMLLLADAWFDTTTAASGGDFMSSLAMAAGVELPLAALCAVLAIRGLPLTASPLGRQAVSTANSSR